MWRWSFLLAFLLAACGRTGIDLAADELGDSGTIGAATGAAGASAKPDASSAIGPDAVSSRSCVWSGFVTRGTYATGAAPVSIAVADFNRDGRLDLATSDWGGAAGSLDGSVSVLLANGPGTFATPTMYKTDIQPTDLAAGDLTDDGFPDLVVPSSVEKLDILRNSGAGTFTSLPLPGPGLTEPLAVAVADLNGDGHLDVAASMGSGAIDVFAGKGDGTLRPLGQYATSVRTYGLAFADLNGDGSPDLVATNLTLSPVMYGRGQIAVLINQGGGKLADQVAYPAGNGTNALAVGDLDGDGHLDVAVANDLDGTIGVFHNAGDGTFGAQVPYDIGPTSSFVNEPGGMAGVVAADFDGDGRLDLATARTFEGDSTIEVLLNAGDGTFRAAVPSAGSPDSPEAIAAADFDGDGRADLAITGQKSITILLSRCR